MKIIISPAKKLNLKYATSNKKMKFNFKKEASDLINTLEKNPLKKLRI